MNSQTPVTISPITPKIKLFNNSLKGSLIKIFMREKRIFMRDK